MGFLEKLGLLPPSTRPPRPDKSAGERSDAAASDFDLQSTIEAGLAPHGPRRDDLARWMITGNPPIDFSRLPWDWDLVNDEYQAARKAMYAAVRKADPIVEWRLAIYEGHRSRTRTPSRISEVLRQLERFGGLPDDDRWDAMLVAADVDEADYLRTVLDLPRSFRRGLNSAYKREADMWRRQSFSQRVRRHPEVVFEKLNGETHEIEIMAEALTSAPGDLCVPFASTIAELASATSKKRRAAGVQMANAAGYEATTPHFQRLAVDGSPAVRAEAIRVWGEVAGDAHRADVIAFCQQRCANDRAAAVHAAIAELVEADERQPLGAAVVWPEPDLSEPSESERQAFLAVYERSRPPRPGPEWEAYRDKVWTYVSTGRGLSELEQPLDWAAGRLAGKVRPTYVFRLKRTFLCEPYTWSWKRIIPAVAKQYHETGHPTLLELQVAAEQAGFDRRDAITMMRPADLWSDETVGEWATAILPELIDLIESTDRPDTFEAFYQAAARVPNLPIDARRYLVNQAVGTSKIRRRLAQMALADQQGIIDEAIDALSGKKAAEREAAAVWLGDLDASEAVPALHRAARRERNDAAWWAELAALQHHGESIEEYLDPAALIDRGSADLAKGLPADCSWIDVGRFPALRWSDGSEVDRRLVEWLVVQAVRRKSSAPSPVVTHLYARMDNDSVAEFAHAVFVAWTAEDLKVADPDEIEARVVRKHAMLQYHDGYNTMDPDDLTALLTKRFSTEPGGSATPARGLLSLVAAGADSSVVGPTESYLRTWFGKRAPQAKALIEMLAWIDDPAATHLMLSVGNRFRTKGIQQEAVRQAELLAERKGWTMEDLAFRTVPTGGFDSDGTLALDYGDRGFVARLTDDLDIVVSDEAGNPIKALPTPRAADDADLAKQAKKQLSDGRAAVKAAAKAQPLRLHEAMCVQREFAPDDFDRYVLGHPVMGRMATRLVWAAVTSEGRALFRPLSDGTLLDVADGEVDIAGAEYITLAHEVIDGVERGDGWRSHFADYDVAPLFAQFGRPAVPELADGQTELLDWNGAIIDARRLRSVIDTVGFVRGDDESEMVVSIERRFVGAGLQARVEVHGMPVAIAEADVALGGLTFVPNGATNPLPLSEVPPVLLVETIAAVEQIAAAGEGIDPNWRQRVDN